MPKIQIPSGQTYGRLTILKEVEPHIEPSGRKRRIVLCRCECGTEKEVRLGDLRSTSIRSCGCYRAEKTKETKTTHGHRKNGRYSKELRAYNNAKDRCNNPDNSGYHRYGGRGIRFLFKSFEGFYTELGPAPFKKAELDRIDNDRHYEPGNVRWTSRRQQANNRSTNRVVKVFGEELTIAQAVRKFGNGLTYGTVNSRINRQGWPIEKALTTPVRKFRQ